MSQSQLWLNPRQNLAIDGQTFNRLLSSTDHVVARKWVACEPAFAFTVLLVRQLLRGEDVEGRLAHDPERLSSLLTRTAPLETELQQMGFTQLGDSQSAVFPAARTLAGPTRRENESAGQDTLSPLPFPRESTSGHNDGERKGIAFALADRLLASSSRIVIATSGTTGRPKQVAHSVKSLTRGLRIGPGHENDVWALAYPLDHFAGLQVLLQALLNGNPIVNLWRTEPRAIGRALQEHRVTHLSATPTFYRTQLPAQGVFAQVRRVISGGERLDPQLIQRLQTVFPNARLHNVYASTEIGSLLTSRGDVFEVPESIAQRVRVVNGELQVHRSLWASEFDEEFGEKSGAEMDAIDRGDSFGGTGDQVEVITKKPLTFRFAGRSCEWINVGGHKVNPQHVEQVLRGFPEIDEAVVRGTPNSVTGQLVTCDLVLKPGATVDEQEIRARLRAELESYEVPRLIQFVPKIETTSTGKVSRS